MAGMCFISRPIYCWIVSENHQDTKKSMVTILSYSLLQASAARINKLKEIK